MKASFLDQVAKHLHDNYGGNLEDVVVVLPNRRASLFLKNYLADYCAKTVWLPEIISSEELVLNLSGLKKIDNINLLFRFYNAYTKQEGKEADEFDEFIQWGQVLLQDFNEIDQYLINTEDLFSFINEARAIEVWNVDGSEITETQRNYLAFWKKLKNYYDAFKQLLISNNECYLGMAFRWVAEHIASDLFNSGKTYLFVGFNALNQSEEKIIDYLLREKKAEVIWDADEYYLNDRSQEAGLFLRRFKKKWDFKPFGFVSKQWLNDEKNITITGINGNINQAYFASELLMKLNDNNNYQHTALVLADEQLLDPVLESLPDCVEHVNVTMGYALEYSPMHSLWLAWIKLHENALKYSSSNTTTYHYKDVIRLLNHPFVKGKEVNDIVNHIVKYNWVFISPKNLLEQIKTETGSELLEILFKPWKDDPFEAIPQMIALVQYYKERWLQEDKLRLNLEYLHLYHKIMLQLQEICTTNKDVIKHVMTIKQLFSQLISKETIDFYGEPLRGLQLMGVLETRTLDFENVILVSTNEGTIPAGKSAQSFIPFEIRRKFKLPTHIEKDALFAYHFYKLLQRAKNIHLLYNTDVDAFSGSEKSRFITQLQYEAQKANPQINIVEQQLTFDVKTSQGNAYNIPKTLSVLETLKNYLLSGVSPSALNTYISCPLDFYYKYILRLREQDEVEEKIEASTMGTVIHEVLEKIYTPFINRVLKAEALKAELSNIDLYVAETFKKHNFTERELEFGKNYLTLKVIVKFISDFLNKEVSFLEKLNQSGQELTILELEKQLSATINLDGQEVLISGVVDRIDKIGNTVRIIDYKTGVVEPKSLVINELSLITTDSKYSKCLQLMLYGLLFDSTYQNAAYDISPGIISFRKLSEGVMGLKIGKEEFTKEHLEEFKVHLKDLFRELLNQEIPFVHNNKALYCNFCDI